MYLKVLKYLTKAISLYMSLMWPPEVSHHNIDSTEDGWSTSVSLQHCPIWKERAPAASKVNQPGDRWGKARLRDSSDPSVKDFKLAVQMVQVEGRVSSRPEPQTKKLWGGCKQGGQDSQEQRLKQNIW